MPNDATHDPLIPDGWDLATSRWATLNLDGKPYRLKPPTIGEFRKITEAVDTASESVLSATQAMTAKLDEVRAAVEAGTATNDSIRELGQSMGREQRDLMRDAWWDVLAGIFHVLGDKELPPEEERPVWLTEDAAAQVAALIKHWKTSPPVRGGR